MATEPKSDQRSRFLRNWMSLAGVVISGGSVFAFLLLFAIDLFAHHGNPYMGILAYVVAPAFFFLGLALMLGGILYQRRFARRNAPDALSPLVINLTRARDRRMLVVFVVCSVVFLLLTAIGSNRTY